MPKTIRLKKARSAKTGRFVKPSYLKRYPDTTYLDTICVNKKS
jgi:hypothetical protein